MNQFKLVVLLIAAMALCATTVAAPPKRVTAELTPPPGSPCPDASGSVSATYEGPLRWPRDNPWKEVKFYQATIGFFVQGLTPGVHYELYGWGPNSGPILVDRFSTGDGSYFTGIYIGTPDKFAAYAVFEYGTDVIVLSGSP